MSGDCFPCTGVGVNGAPGGGGGGGFSPAFSRTPAFTQVGATVGTLALVSLPNAGDRAVLNGLTVSAIFTAGVPAGDVGQIAYAGAVQVQRGATDAVVVTFGTQPWGPPPGVPALQPTSTGYQPPLAFGSPGGIAVALGVAGPIVFVQGTGIAGFTTRFDVWGEIRVFGTAVRLV